MDAFSSIITAEDSGLMKPDPEIFRLAARAMGRNTHYMLYIGDNYRWQVSLSNFSDYLGAKSAGATSLWLTRKAPGHLLSPAEHHKIARSERISSPKQAHPMLAA